MILERLYEEKLSQASYLVGCSETGEALVVDPARDVDAILQAAERHGLRITRVAETHIHADFVSGARELAARTGATLLLSDEGGPDWRYAFARQDRAVLLHHGDRFEIGTIRVEVLHTPGHTPEHLCFVVTAAAGADRPMGVLTGDCLFVGDVGRPDLLERSARREGTMETSARQLFRSLRELAGTLPDYVQIWPGHGAGSACGKSLAAVPQSTLGYEKLFNWAFQEPDEDGFVAAVLSGQPEPPLYFAEMKRVNREGPAVLGAPNPPVRMPESRLGEVLASGAIVLDTRDAEAFADSHLPGSFHAPFASRSFLTWAGSVLPYDREIYLVADEEAEAIARDLALIGIDRIAGAFSTAAARSWSAARDDAHATVRQVDPDEIGPAPTSRERVVLDVRNPSEWEAGHIPGSLNLPLGGLLDHLEEIPRDRQIVVHCQTGARAMVAVAALQAHGFPDVRHLAGDYAHWTARHRPA